VRDVEHSTGGADSPVLSQNPLILDRQSPTGERNELPPGGEVLLLQGGMMEFRQVQKEGQNAR